LGYLTRDRAVDATALSAPRSLGAGVYDGLSALMAARHGFDFLWVSSFCVSAARGMPDAGLVDPALRARTVAMIRSLVAQPIVVDMDAASDDPVKTYVEVRELIQAGANAVCIEDVSQRKRSSLYDEHPHQLAPVEAHLGRIRSAAEAFRAEGEPPCVISRTEALVAGLGVQEALRRAEASLRVGADAIFIQSLDATGEEALRFCAGWERRTPVFLAPTRYGTVSRDRLFSAGASHLIFANQALRAAHRAVDQVFARMHRVPDLDVSDGISPVSSVAQEVGAQVLLELEAHLDPTNGN
jgi:phosphoenolpyruvate phosphomutase